MQATFQLCHLGLLSSAPILHAAQIGAFEAESIPLHIRSELGEASIMARLLEGTIDAVCMTATSAVAEAMNTRERTLDGVVHTLLTRNGYAIVITKDIVERLQDSRSRNPLPAIRMGVPGSPSCARMLVHRWHQSLSLDRLPEPQCIPVPISQAIEFLAEGVIDGFCMSDPLPAIAQFIDAGVIAATSTSLAPDHPNALILSPASSILATPAQSQRLLRALHHGQTFCANPANLSVLLQRCLDDFAKPYLSGPQRELLVATATKPGSTLITSRFVASPAEAIISERDQNFMEVSTLFSLGTSGRKAEIRNHIARLFRGSLPANF